MSKNFPEYKQLSLTQIADEILAKWKTENTFEKSITTREGNENFVFYEGPPSANGLPGIHHVLARSIKDIFCRYQTLNGKKVNRKAGWDTHGLPVELGVEKELGITKEDIGTKISVEEYNEACKKAVMRYTDIWNDLTQKMGYWVDLEDPYVTYTSKYMESVWWLLKQLFDKNLIYKGYTIQPYSPKAGTGLSSHELNMPGAYQDVSDTSVVAQFKVIKESNPKLAHVQGDLFFIAWTTTPWTLPSNTALTVGKKIEYVRISTYNQYTFEPIQVILAKKLVAKQFAGKYKQINEQADLENYTKEAKKIPYYIEETILGNELLDTRYEQLLEWAKPYAGTEEAFKVIHGDFVTTEDGTGIVHTAPTFGADDAKVAQDNNVPPMLVQNENGDLVPLVDLKGKFINLIPEPFGGKYVKNEYYNEADRPEKSIDVEISIHLKTQNRAFRVEKYKHNYPHCWRTDKPILYYPLDSWFIRVTDKKEELVRLNEKINWKPKSTGTGRFGNWLKNANDWNLSRSRFWGIPLPIWRNEQGTETKMIGSIEELYNEIEQSIASGYMQENPFKGFEVNNFSQENYEKVDLHKNIVDKIVLVGQDGGKLYREKDLIDVWFDSGSMPYAQWHYPFENKEKLDEVWPADFIAEGVDQTRGWFYTLHAISGMVFGKEAYKNVVSNGLVLDANGQKMSKRLGNAVDPFYTLEKYGPDATRWYMISNAQPWENLKFSWTKPNKEKGEDFEEYSEGIDEVRRKFFGTLYNTYSFFALYANVDGFKMHEAIVPVNHRSELDQWILSELHSLVNEVQEFYETYEPTRAARAIQSFVIDNMSNWYVRLSRRVFWKGDYGTEKIAAYQTLFELLETISIIASPIAPFFMDKLYCDLQSVKEANEKDSVHLANFPKVNKDIVNVELQERTRISQKLTSMVLSLRRNANMKVRQPLNKIMLPYSSEEMKARFVAISELLKQELNLKNVELVSSKEASSVLVKGIKPNFKSLGPKVGKDMKRIAQATAQLTASDIAELEASGKITLNLEKDSWELELNDFEITTKDIPGWAVANQNELTVALDLQLTPELVKEGLARELVNRIQNLRKETGLEVTDRIKIHLENQTEIAESLKENKNYICAETLADDLVLHTDLESGSTIEVNEFTTKIAIEKV